MRTSAGAPVSRPLFLIIALIASLFTQMWGASPIQKADCGRIDRLTIFSPQLADSIDIDVWVPVTTDTEMRYPVIYMHDGQNLFDATTTWNGQSWEMDRAMCELINSGNSRPAIIVGIHSDPEKRVSQLMPQKAVCNAGLDELMAEVKLKGQPVMGDAYADFVVNTLKPVIDSSYPVLPGLEDTSVMGSSMGGLMSLYLICEYPEVFGAAGCLSTHWYGSLEAGDAFGNALMNYMREKLPSSDNYKIYFDHGTSTIDAYYGPWNTQALLIAQQKGYNYGVNLDSYVDSGAPHNEAAWAARVARPLTFLLSK